MNALALCLSIIALAAPKWVTKAAWEEDQNRPLTEQQIMFEKVWDLWGFEDVRMGELLMMVKEEIGQATEYEIYIVDAWTREKPESEVRRTSQKGKLTLTFECQMQPKYDTATLKQMKLQRWSMWVASGTLQVGDKKLYMHGMIQEQILEDASRVRTWTPVITCDSAEEAEKDAREFYELMEGVKPENAKPVIEPVVPVPTT